MASTTTNLGLKKPARDDYVNVVTDINDNMDTLDGVVVPNTRTVNGQALSGNVTIGTGVNLSGDDYKIVLGGGS